MRLAFAIATANRPEILLIDEVFGTGDLGFRVKAKQRLAQLIDTARIIVMVGTTSRRSRFLRHGHLDGAGPNQADGGRP